MLSRLYVALHEATKLCFCELELQEAATAMHPLLYPASSVHLPAKFFSAILLGGPARCRCALS